jgi:hypothetical protein
MDRSGVVVKTRWVHYLPGLLCGFFVWLSVKYGTKMFSALSAEPQILPVYDESGKLEGFTHPTLVAAAEQHRESQRKA